jgi:extracellular elastinolytic metalloproteinase
MRHALLVRALLALVATALVLVPATASAGQAKDKDAALDAARKYLQENKQQLGLTGADLNGAVVTDQYTDAHNGVTHVYFQQQHKGIAVETSSLGVRNGTRAATTSPSSSSSTG